MRTEDFVRAASEGRRSHAEALLAAEPAIGDDRWARLVLGRGWDGDPNEAGGPHGLSPLYYASCSVFDTDALLRELLERGAEPDDNESLYHAAYADSPERVRILLQHGATVVGTNAVAAAIDGDRVELVRMLLEGGGDPNEGALVAHAVRRGCGASMIELLAEQGADLDRPGGERWRGEVPLRTPYQHAVLRGKDELAALLARLGASTEVDPADAAVAAIARGERPETSLPADLDPDAQEVIVLSALRGNLELVLEVVGPGFRGVVGGSPEGTLLHHAAWVGSPELVRRLLERGADPVARSGADFDTPLEWAVLASKYHGLPNRDFVGVAELLVAAGAELEPRYADSADGPLAEWLQSTSIASPNE